MLKSPIPHLYVHVPFCSGKCTYCVLYSVMYDPPRAARYVDALAAEMDAFLRQGHVLRPETIFIGGGTPSGLDDALFARLLEHIRTRINPAALTEWTIEAQPGTLTTGKLAAMRNAGVNRISFGVQALRDATLKRIGRRHSVADVSNALAQARAAGINNVSMDLIACLPGVSPAEWHETLTHLAAFNLPHASAYALTIEPGSIMEKQIARGEMSPPDEDAQIAALAAAETIFGAAGLHRYEFSNYARPGHECRHNLAYWRGRDYVGFGPAAASRLGRTRWTNVSDVNAYVADVERGTEAPRECETLDPAADMTERLMFGFRLAEGVDLHAFGEPDADRMTQWRDTLDRLQQQGVVEPNGTRWRLTRAGRLYADAVAEQFV